MRLPDKGETMTGLGIRNRVIPGRGKSTNSVPTATASSPRPGYTLPPTAEDGPPPYPSPNLSNKPSYSSLQASKPRYGASPGLSPTPAQDQWGARRTSSASYASSNGTTTTNGHDDYFGR